MTTLSRPVTEAIEQRFSCRNYLNVPIEAQKQQQLADVSDTISTGPFGSPTRFGLLAATEANRKTLQGLGTYGFIKNPMGFIVGAMGKADKNLEDFGFAMERIVLLATDIGLGTCWLGGSFTRSRFARKIAATNGERVPAVVSVGYSANGSENSMIRRRVGGSRRYAWDKLFFDQRFGIPLSRKEAGAYAEPLEMVRLGPSASNKQPWRIVKDGNAWHFYIQRTPGYQNRWIVKLLSIDDMQRIDAGIAMCHFELTAQELGLTGRWTVEEPAIQKPNQMTEYTASWVSRAMGKV